MNSARLAPWGLLLLVCVSPLHGLAASVGMSVAAEDLGLGLRVALAGWMPNAAYAALFAGFLGMLPVMSPGRRALAAMGFAGLWSALAAAVLGWMIASNQSCGVTWWSDTAWSGPIFVGALYLPHVALYSALIAAFTRPSLAPYGSLLVAAGLFVAGLWLISPLARWMEDADGHWILATLRSEISSLPTERFWGCGVDAFIRFEVDRDGRPYCRLICPPTVTGDDCRGEVWDSRVWRPGECSL